MTKTCKEPGLFNDYHEAELKGGAFAKLERDGEVEIRHEGDWGESDCYIYLSVDELERLARAARALKEYDEAETARVAYEKEQG
jgi:hypothetical protein